MTDIKTVLTEEQAEPDYCQACEGSGEAVGYEGSGPNIHEVSIACSVCKGTGDAPPGYEAMKAENERLAAEVERLKAAQPTDFDAEFLSKRLARVAKLAGVSMPDLTHRDIAGVAGTILGTIASKLERASQPQEAGQARELTDDEIVKALHSAGIDTYPSKYGFDALQVSATSVPNLRKVIEVFAQSSPAVPEGLSDELILRCAGGKLEFLSQSGLLHFARTIIAEYKARIPAAAPSAPQQKEGE